MQSTFGWVDFLEEDKHKMHELIKALSEQDTRDELGIGSIRDAFANLFFPGTSTIQTRVKYMLFIPWIYQSIEEEKVSSVMVTTRSRELENTLIEALLNSDDTDGVIGKEARNKLIRTPADIYWAGLRNWGIFKYHSSRADYHNNLDNYYRLVDKQLLDDDHNPVQGMVYNWDPGVPASPGEFPAKAHFALSFNEAAYLNDKIKTNCSGALLSRLIDP